MGNFIICILIFIIIFLLFLLIIKFYGIQKHNSIVTVPVVDLKKYQGKWYEIARLPNPFQHRCVRSSAYYQIIDNNRISVINSCIVDGMEYKISGTAYPYEGRITGDKMLIPGRLQIIFNNIPSVGIYNIIYISPTYHLAIVSSDKMRYLWFLAREPRINMSELLLLLRISQSLGYDVNNIIIDPYVIII